jgi:5-methylcytosine-specific restriction endonuclease McrA
MKEYAKHFYKSKAWQRTRYAYIISKQGQCERCGQGGKIVHHKIYIDPTNIYNEAITLDHNNLELLCQTCHNQEHTGTQTTATGTRFDEHGQLILNPPH